MLNFKNLNIMAILKASREPDIVNFFDDVFGDFFVPKSSIRKGLNVPAVNVAEGEKGFEIEVAAPGYEKGDFNISLDNNVLLIKAEKEVSKEEKKMHRKEFEYASFERAFTLPENVDEEKIEASYKNGILKLFIPFKDQKEVEARKTIKIK